MSCRTLVGRTVAGVVAVTVLSVVGAPVEARDGAAAVKIGSTATIVDGGTAVMIGVAARCAAGYTIIESFVTVSQEGVDSDMGFFTPTCDGRWHRHLVRVDAFEPTTYHPGTAQASAYLLVCNASGDCPSAQDGHVVQVS